MVTTAIRVVTHEVRFWGPQNMSLWLQGNALTNNCTTVSFSKDSHSCGTPKYNRPHAKEGRNNTSLNKHDHRMSREGLRHIPNTPPLLCSSVLKPRHSIAIHMAFMPAHEVESHACCLRKQFYFHPRPQPQNCGARIKERRIL
jgi:hypothetical protein